MSLADASNHKLGGRVDGSSAHKLYYIIFAPIHGSILYQFKKFLIFEFKIHCITYVITLYRVPCQCQDVDVINTRPLTYLWDKHNNTRNKYTLLKITHHVPFWEVLSSVHVYAMISKNTKRNNRMGVVTSSDFCVIETRQRRKV